jgi:DNA-binding PadR family transcriptional regulator
MAKRRKVTNLLGLVLLSLLVPGVPMHPYEMANVLRRTGKEQDVQIKWGSLYTVVQNLEKHGFIAATGSDRAGRRPERTVYTITDLGRAELEDWLRELVAEPQTEFPRFESALSVIGVLPLDEVIGLLQRRLATLDERIARDRAALTGVAVPRIYLIEAEYALAMQEAEAAWVRSLLGELTEGTLDGIDQWRSFHDTGTAPAEWVELLEGLDQNT